MSYIHDALKSSARQREALQAGQTAVPEPELRERSREAGWSPGRVLLILLLLLLGFWFWRGATGPLPQTPDVVTLPEAVPDVPAQVPALPEVETEIETRAPPDRPSAEELKGVKIRLNAPVASPSRPAAGSPLSVTQPSSTAGEATSSVGAVQKPQTPAAGTSAAAEVQAEDPYSRLPYLRQLPAEQQRELQGLHFSVHIYAEQPAARLVKHENRILREGDFVRSGLRIVEIIPHGVVLQYRQMRFRVPAL